MRFAIRSVRPQEFATLVEIELAAGRAFAEVGLPEIAADDPGSPAELAAFLQTGSGWAATDDDDRPVAYLLSIAVDDCAHIEQVSVEPDHARRGIGAALIDHLAAIAKGEGRAGLSLTTFRDVPWNAPYYARLGFDIVAPEAYGPQLAALVAHEAQAIPGDAPRVAMRRSV
jgi:GNAT superfamily N-acetyltransferase